MLRLTGDRSRGDVVLFTDVGLDPAGTLLEAGPPHLVVIGGRIRLCSAAFAERLPRNHPPQDVSIYHRGPHHVLRTRISATSIARPRLFLGPIFSWRAKR